MPLYESVFVVRQDVSAQHVESLAERYGEMIRENGGEVAKTEYWGLRNLAYRVKKNRKGHYTMFNIDGPPAAVAELERNMRLSEDVLRYLTIRVDAFEEGPSAIIRNRGGREDRHRDRHRDSAGARSREREKEREREREKEASSAKAAGKEGGS